MHENNPVPPFINNQLKNLSHDPAQRYVHESVDSQLRNLTHDLAKRYKISVFIWGRGWSKWAQRGGPPLVKSFLALVLHAGENILADTPFQNSDPCRSICWQFPRFQMLGPARAG